MRVAVERYKVDTVGPPLPPPGIPAFLRINATSPPTTVEIVGERVATIDTIFGPYVERSIYLKHSNPNATIYATVFSASPPSAFKPYYVNGLNLDQLAPLYRLVLPSNGFTYYTTWPKDKDNALEGGWKYNGIACWVFIGPQPGTTPLHRLYNTFGEHFITTDDDERARISAPGQGWTYEQIQCYVLTSAQMGAVPLYRLTHPTRGHLFTTYWQERDDITRKDATGALVHGYKLEFTACYVFADRPQGPDLFPPPSLVP